MGDNTELAARQKEGASEARNKRVLLVDDQPKSIRILKKRLQEKGVDVVSARTINQAMGEIKKNIVDLMIIDLYLPTDWNYLSGYKEKINLTLFNQGELLGVVAVEKQMPFFYYTNHRDFYKGDDCDERLMLKSDAIDIVTRKAFTLLGINS